MIDEVSDEKLNELLNQFLREQNVEQLRKDKRFKEGYFFEFKINNDDFQTVKVQLRALGLMNKSIKSRSVKDTDTYWSLTPYGDEVMTKLRAIKK